ncbi:lipopolysaccharide-induced tumor necrosis factor-alpha factor [Mytilus galloprovincialis]|uniref:Lipopolysaccharide-induced tumor necrosis factor-alpha factor n=1 Tax=Mytilus galloprovincialis TaxID=29158 RepID=A0A8B6BHN1_MYTGA|nr:lipopolysaccharide-induced tumor necrosis factor-alpha factor [Mytilus galloprovincialis]
MEKQGNLPPPPQYSHGGQQSTVVITSPAMLGPQFREVPVRTQCPACQADIMTSTRYETGTLTWISIGALCLFGCWLGCCLIPLVLIRVKTLYTPVLTVSRWLESTTGCDDRCSMTRDIIL